MNKTKKKQNYLKTVRIIIQLLFFILLPGLYANAFLGIRLIYQGILGHNFSLSSTFPQLISAIAIIPATLLFGRFFCGWMCAFGTLGDMLYLLSRKVFKISYKVNEKTDHILKYVKYIVLVYILIIAWSFQTSNFSSYSPWDAFGNLLSFTRLPDFSYVITNFTVGFILLLAIIAASLFVERFFCRYLCPLGAVFAVISHLRFIKIKKPNKECGLCKACTKKCTMGIPLYQMNHVSSGECINCMKCIPVCPRDNVNIAVTNTAVNPALAGALAVTAIAGVYYIGNFATDSMAATSQPTAQAENTQNSGIYTDGTYEGTGTGFRGATTTVSVTVSGGVITDIQALSYGDDNQFFDRAFSSIVGQIISTQSADVDAVSGATFSSNGIMEAVTDALDSAKQAADSSSNTVSADITSNSSSDTVSADITSDSPSNTVSADILSDSSSKTAPTDIPSNSSSNIASKDSSTKVSDSTDTSVTPVEKTKSKSSSKYTNGVYEGSANGFHRGVTTVSVTVKDDVITDIQVISNGDTPQFFDSASSTVISEILDSQSTNVDAVSGATFSSMGIMNAVDNALSIAQNS